MNQEYRIKSYEVRSRDEVTPLSPSLGKDWNSDLNKIDNINKTIIPYYKLR